jgi:hypothetical protein
MSWLLIPSPKTFTFGATSNPGRMTPESSLRLHPAVGGFRARPWFDFVPADKVWQMLERTGDIQLGKMTVDCK